MNRAIRNVDVTSAVTATGRSARAAHAPQVNRCMRFAKSARDIADPRLAYAAINAHRYILRSRTARFMEDFAMVE